MDFGEHSSTTMFFRDEAPVTPRLWEECDVEPLVTSFSSAIAFSTPRELKGAN